MGWECRLVVRVEKGIEASTQHKNILARTDVQAYCTVVHRWIRLEGHIGRILEPLRVVNVRVLCMWLYTGRGVRKVAALEIGRLSLNHREKDV